MNKQQFITELQKQLCGLPLSDINQTLQYYSEMIDDRIEDGLSEQEAVASIGDPQKIAKEILMDIPLPKLVKQKIKSSRRMSALELVLLILGSPVWLSLIIAAIAVVLSVYVVLWSVIISLYAVSFSLAACGVAGVFAFAVFGVTGNMISGVFVVGCALVCAGTAILIFMASNLITKGLLRLSRKIWCGIKSCFKRKGDNNENC